MGLTQRQKQVLVGVLQDRERFADLDWENGETIPGWKRRALRRRVHRAQSGLVPMNLAGWIGDTPTGSEAVMFCREYQRLDRMGLIERHSLFARRRTTHLRLTEAGEEIARAILEGREPPDIDWGKIELLPIELEDLQT